MEKMDVQQRTGQTPDITIFTLKGAFVLGSMFELQRMLREPSVEGVIIDLSGVEYIDSAGLGLLLGQWSHTQRCGFRFALAGMSRRVHTIFELTRTDTVVPICATVEEAESAFSGSATA